MSGPSTKLRNSLEKNLPGLVPLLDLDASIPIFTRLDPNFAEQRAIYNLGIDVQPWAVVCPASEAEVLDVVRACSASKPVVPISIRVGGHDFGGRSLVSDGVVIDLRRLDNIALAGDRASVRVGGGALTGAVATFLDGHGLATPIGWCNMVGYVGWATGGGYGSMQGTHGFGVDQILGARVVTANGGIIDTDEDPELLWALRGAGTGVLGVIVELRVKTYPIPKMLAGTLTFSIEDAHKVLIEVGELCKRHHPDEFSGDFLATKAPGIGCVLICLFSWTQKLERDDGDLTEGKALLEKICSMASVLANTVTESGFILIIAIWAALLTLASDAVRIFSRT